MNCIVLPTVFGQRVVVFTSGLQFRSTFNVSVISTLYIFVGLVTQ